MIVTRTPLRISFAGGGTDLPSFYRSNTYGLVLNTSISAPSTDLLNLDNDLAQYNISIGFLVN